MTELIRKGGETSKQKKDGEVIRIQRGHLWVWYQPLVVLTFLIKGKLVVAQAAGLFAHELVHIVSA